MAAALRSCRDILTCISSSQRLLTKRFYRYNVLNVIKKQKRMFEDDVYLLCSRERTKHSFDEALTTLRCYSFFKNETITLYIKIKLGNEKRRLVDISQVRGTCVFPKAFGRPKKFLVFAEGEQAEIAKEHGVETVGGEELFPLVTEGQITFDYCLSTLDMLNKLTPLRRILREKIPNTKRGTATDDLPSIISNLSRGQYYKARRDGRMNINIGKMSFSDDEIKSNALQAVKAVNKHRLIAKGKFFETFILCSTNGPSLDLSLNELLPELKK